MTSSSAAFISNLEKYRNRMTGEFGHWQHADGTTSLESIDDVLYERSSRLAELGYVPAGVIVRAGTLSGTSESERAAQWDAWRAAEAHSDDGLDLPVIPDDYNPNATDGRALSGNRRIHRIQYGRKAHLPVMGDDGQPVLGADGQPLRKETAVGPQLRMPSATAIKSWCRQGETMGAATVPIHYEFDDANGRVWSGQVRVTNLGPNQYEVVSVGNLPPHVRDQVENRIGAVLEGVRPSFALNDAAVIEKRKAEVAERQGHGLRPIAASWFSEAAIVPAPGGKSVLVVKGDSPLKGTGERPLYGYELPPAVAARIANSEHPATALTAERKAAMARGETLRVEIKQCSACGRIESKVEKHVCRAAPKSEAAYPSTTADRIAVTEGKGAARRFLSTLGDRRERRRRV